MSAPGQTDCSGTFTAPASRAESGGCTVWSSVLHSDSHGGRALARLLQLSQQGAARRELLAGDGALTRVERGTHGRDARAVQRGTQRDDPGRPALAAVVDVP